MPDLDVKDRKILFELDTNARSSSSQIAKKVKLNKNTVNYKIHRLEEEKYITGYYAVIDSSKLGYFSVRVYFKFLNTTKEKEEEIFNWLKDNHLIGVVAKIDTLYDVAFIAWIKNIYQFSSLWNEFKEKYRKYMWQERVNITSQVLHYKRKYLLEGKTVLEECETIGGEEIIKYDDLDIKLLQKLAKNAKISLVQLSQKLNTPARTLAFRIKQLEKKKVIQGYRANFDLKKLGFEYYKVNFILDDYKNKKELEHFCAQHKNIIFIDKTLEEFDFEIDVEIENKEKLFALIEHIKKMIPVRDAIIFTFNSYLKLESMPQI